MTDRRRQLEENARRIADERATFLRNLGARTPTTPQERARWSELVNARRAVDDQLERLSLEERISEHEQQATLALTTGNKRTAAKHQAEAEHLWARLGGLHG